jgi:ubiquinone biosynthesis protein UbiJ
MTLKPSVDAFFAVLNAGPVGLQRHLRIEGDVLFAAALGELAQGLRWDAEEDLSRWVGDVMAHRLVAGGRLLADSLRQSFERAMRSSARFAATESQALVSRPELDLHRDELQALDHRVTALERQRGR